MSRPATAWREIRRAYERGESCAHLAARYALAVGTVRRHARQEHWDSGGQNATVSRRLAQSARSLQQTASALLSNAETEGEVSVKEIKELAALLRELTALERSLSEQEEAPELRVVLEPPLEEWAE